ncbi:MAG TPA: dihydrofolate reductase [Candidatus Paceibacterota bacterium]
MELQKVRISIVVAIGRDKKHNRVIGRDNKLLWHIPDDLKRFKALTIGHPIIMGRRTFESIVASLGTALPERLNIVVTRDTSWSYPEVTVCHSLPHALSLAKRIDSEEVFIGGGTELYTQALPYVDRLYLTLIDDEQEGDAFFPDHAEFTKVVEPEEHRIWNDLKYAWVTLER